VSFVSPYFVLMSLVTAGASVWIFMRSHRQPVFVSWFLFSFNMALWGLTLGVLTSISDPKILKMFYWAHFTSAVFIPLTFLHFINIAFKRRRRVGPDIYAGAVLACLLIAGIWTGKLIGTLASRWHFDQFVSPGPWFWIFIAYAVFFVGLAFFRMIQGTLQGEKRDWIRNFIFTTLAGIGFLGGASAVIPGWDSPIVLFGLCVFLAFPVLATYVLILQRLFNLEELVKKAVVFLAMSISVYVVFVSVSFLFRNVLEVYWGISPKWGYWTSIFLIVLGYESLRNLFSDWTERYMFQAKYDYQKFLRDASQGISKIESLERLFKLVIHFITMKMRLRNAAILTKDPSQQEFILRYQRGYERSFVEYRIAESSPLIQFLTKERRAAEVDRIRDQMEMSTAEEEYDYHELLHDMEQMQGACCIPSFLGQELRNILVLGEKKTREVFTEEDLTVLFTLAQESAIAIENARLYDEAIGKTHELEKINQQLGFSKSLLMKSLKETEVANKQLTDTQAQLIHEQKMATLGRLAASVGHEVNNPLTILSMNVSRALLKYRKNPDLKVAEVVELFEKMEQNIGRIKAVVNTLTGLLKRSEKGKFEPLSLKLVLEETLPLVQFQTYLDNLAGTEVDFDIPGNIPLIRGDLERLQEVFLNLFINAYHAMESRRNRRIRVTAEADKESAHYVKMHFQDNGKGMSEETMKKIFNYGFTTKPPGRGSGMGLYMCKYIIELHGGSLNVKSQEGVGTTFILTLPIYEESESIQRGGGGAFQALS